MTLKSELCAVATILHADIISYSRKYDGVIGVLRAIKAMRVL